MTHLFIQCKSVSHNRTRVYIILYKLAFILRKIFSFSVIITILAQIDYVDANQHLHAFDISDSKQKLFPMV